MSDKKILVRDTGPASRRGMDEALRYVSKNWFPVNPGVLKHIQTKIKAGQYQENVTALVTDLKTDLSLYSWCLMRLKDFTGEQDATRNPAEVLLSLELEKMQKLLSVPEDQVSIHHMTPDMKAQAIGLRHALISSSTAEVLAEKAQLDSQTAFMCASVRQLGLNLVAWNYPRIYSKALAAMSGSEARLDEELLKVLGYSPLQLGFRAALDWNQCIDFQKMAGIDAAETGSAKLSSGKAGSSASDDSPTAQMRRFCEIGETLARINDPEHFPHAAREWEDVVGELNYYLGPQGVAVISERLKQHGSNYQQFSSALFKLEITPEKSLKVAHTQYSNKLYEQNTYIRKCPEEAQPAFQRVYAAMVSGAPSSAAVNLLVSLVIPMLGFSRGCVYLVDPNKLVISPMLRVGDAPLSRYRPLSASNTGSNQHPVVLALSYSAPIVQEGAIVNGDQVSHVTGVFGTRDKSGVLYLEMKEDLAKEVDRTKALLHFKAIRQTLNDCLNLR